MKSYRLTAAQAMSYPHKHPERTARRRAGAAPLEFDLVFQVWPSREAMARLIRKQERNGPSWATGLMDDWRPLVPLADGEGY